MHPQGHWEGGQAMHRTQELGMGRAWPPAGKGGRGDTDTERRDRHRKSEQSCHLYPGHGQAGTTIPGVS